MNDIFRSVVKFCQKNATNWAVTFLIALSFYFCIVSTKDDNKAWLLAVEQIFKACGRTFIWERSHFAYEPIRPKKSKCNVLLELGVRNEKQYWP